MLKNFLCDVLELPSSTIKGIQVLNSEILPEDIKGKQVRLDIRVQADDRIIDMEMPMQDKGDFRDRGGFDYDREGRNSRSQSGSELYL